MSWAIAISGSSCPGRTVARLGADRLGGGGAGGGRGGAGALHAGVHVRLVVVADVQHVVVALEHAGQAGHADVDRAAVAALGHHRMSVRPLAFSAAATPDATAAAFPNSECSHGICQEVSGNGVENTSRQPVALTAIILPLVARMHGVERVARAERLAAALAGAMPAGQRVGAAAAPAWTARWSSSSSRLPTAKLPVW